METQDNNPEQPIYLQKDINYGQARINFELNEIDKDVIRALNLIVQVLKTVKALPSLMHDLKEIDFSTIDKALSDACERSKTVADIRPPGCEAPVYKPPPPEEI